MLSEVLQLVKTGDVREKVVCFGVAITGSNSDSVSIAGASAGRELEELR